MLFSWCGNSSLSVFAWPVPWCLFARFVLSFWSSRAVYLFHPRYVIATRCMRCVLISDHNCALIFNLPGTWSKPISLGYCRRFYLKQSPNFNGLCAFLFYCPPPLGVDRYFCADLKCLFSISSSSTRSICRTVNWYQFNNQVRFCMYCNSTSHLLKSNTKFERQRKDE